MEWMVQDWNEGAIRFYERRGAVQLSEWHTYRIDQEQLGVLAERPASQIGTSNPAHEPEPPEPTS
jgi:hypothetical protein